MIAEKIEHCYFGVPKTQPSVPPTTVWIRVAWISFLMSVSDILAIYYILLLEDTVWSSRIVVAPYYWDKQSYVSRSEQETRRQLWMPSSTCLLSVVLDQRSHTVIIDTRTAQKSRCFQQHQHGHVMGFFFKSHGKICSIRVQIQH